MQPMLHLQSIVSQVTGPTYYPSSTYVTYSQSLENAIDQCLIPALAGGAAWSKIGTRTTVISICLLGRSKSAAVKGLSGLLS